MKSFFLGASSSPLDPSPVIVSRQRSGSGFSDESTAASAARASVPLKPWPPPAEPPLDPQVYYLFMLLGAGLLMPWNVIINSGDYLSNLYKDSEGHNTSMGKHILYFITVANSFPGLPLLFVMVRYGSLVPAHVRVVACCVTQAGVLALLTLSYLSPWVPISLAVVSGMSTVVLQSSLIGLSSLFPPQYSVGFMMGQGLSGILSSVGQIAVQGLANGGGVSSGPTFTYFALGSCVMLACVGAVLRLRALPYSRALLDSASSAVDAGGEASPRREASLRREASPQEFSEDVPAEHGDDTSSLLRGGAARPSIKSVLRKTWQNLASVFLVFVGTFLCVAAARRRPGSKRRAARILRPPLPP